jgi:glycosyltransferase involved in cell wall biosynthesis
VVLVGHSYLAEENRKQLDALGQFCEVDVLSPRSWHEGMTHYDIEPGTVAGQNWRLHFLGERRVPGLPQSQYLLPGLTAALKRLRPDLIHIESDPWTTFAAQAIRARNRLDRSVPVVCTAKQNTYTDRGGLRDLVKRKLARWGIRNTARFIAVSPAVENLYRERFGVDSSRFDLQTHLGVDTGLFCPADEVQARNLRRQWTGDEARGALLIGYCGRLEEYKGVTDLVEAIIGARRETGRDIRLMLLGSGSLQEFLQEKATACGWLHLAGQIPHAQVARFMQALDLFVMPSRRSARHEEHDGHAVIEALSCGLPCIGTDSGVLPLLEGVGSIAAAGDSDGLKALIIQLEEKIRSDPEARSNRAGRLKMNGEYSLQAVAKANWNSYRKAMEHWHEPR